MSQLAEMEFTSLLSEDIAADLEIATPFPFREDFAADMEMFSQFGHEDAPEVEAPPLLGEVSAAETDVPLSYLFAQEDPIGAFVPVDKEKEEETQRVRRTIKRQLRSPAKQCWRNYFNVTKALHRFKLAGDLSLADKTAYKGLSTDADRGGRNHQAVERGAPRNVNYKDDDDPSGTSGLSSDAIRRKWRKPLVALKVCRQFKSTLQTREQMLDKREQAVRDREAQLNADFSRLSLDNFRQQRVNSIAFEQALHTPERLNVSTAVTVDWEAEQQKLLQKSHVDDSFKALKPLRAELGAKMNERTASTVQQLASRRKVVADELASNRKQLEKLQEKLEVCRTAMDEVSKQLEAISEELSRGSSAGVDESNELVRGKLVRSLADVKRKAAGALKKLGTRRVQCSKERKLNNDALAEQRLFQDFAASVSAEFNTVLEKMSATFVSIETIHSWFLEFTSSTPSIDAEQQSGSTSTVLDIPIGSGGQPELGTYDFIIPDRLESPPSLDICDYLISDEME